jgi:tRNA threonylcarbamoyladenosine biosynthesis protein TsaB
MYILVIDTATKRLSVSLIDIRSRINIAYYIEKEEDNSHAKRINLVIQQLLKENQIELKHLSAIALNEGPGSFTGLRVGSSTAKGLCFALEIPLITICGLTSYGKHLYSIKADDITDIFVLMDARRGNYFYIETNAFQQYSTAKFDHISNIESRIYLSKKPWLVYLEKEEELELGAICLISHVLEKWERQQFADIKSFEPQYIVNNYEKKK